MLPVIQPGRTMVTWGGAGSSFMVTARSPKAQESVAFLEWLTAQPQQQFLLEATHNIPANRLAVAQLPSELAAFADDMDAVVHPRLLGAQEHSTVIEAFDKGVQSILIGEETPIHVAQAVEQVKRREDTRQASLAAAREATHATP